jgi:uncharacterized membrane protein YecN with MAPEG domain
MDTTISPACHAAALWAGLILFVMLVLSVLVVRQRQKHRVLIGDEGVPDLMLAVRAFGNAAEYAPAGMAALALMALVGAQPLVVHVVGALLFAGRIGHAWGLSRSSSPTLGRSIGMVLTWLAFLIAGALLLFYSVP